MMSTFLLHHHLMTKVLEVNKVVKKVLAVMAMMIASFVF